MEARARFQRASVTVEGLQSSSVKSLAGCFALLGRLAAGLALRGKNPRKAYNARPHFKTARVEVLLRVPVMAAFLGDMRTGVDTPTTQGWKQKVRKHQG